jgi:hypothetical protein
MALQGQNASQSLAAVLIGVSQLKGYSQLHLGESRGTVGGMELVLAGMGLMTHYPPLSSSHHR